ncbi:MAG: hypothetical protein JNL61_11315 [Rhizobiaceae bacterium]|nr:hypothetical protein [Rhizobiaceae bacterium]
MSSDRPESNIRADFVSALFLCLSVALACAFGSTGGFGSTTSPETGRAASGMSESGPRPGPVEFKRLVVTVEAQATGTASSADEGKGKAALASAAPGLQSSPVKTALEASPSRMPLVLPRLAYAARAPPFSV